LRLSRAASVAILPSALFVSDDSLGASWAFSFQQVLLPVNRDHRRLGIWQISESGKLLQGVDNCSWSRIFERMAKGEGAPGSDHQDLYSGLIRIHILFHASEGPIWGLEMIEELKRHGYRISAGTLYPLLHGLEKRGLLSSKQTRAGRWIRREYRATAAGRTALREAKKRVQELFGEIFEAN